MKSISSLTRLAAPTTKKICINVLCLCFFYAPLKGQITYNLGVNAGMHSSSSLVDGHFIGRDDIADIFSAEKYYLTPEIALHFDVTLARRHTIGIRPSIVYYERVFTVVMPISLYYDFRLFKKEKTPFARAEIGYSFFFISQGLRYSIAIGYKWNRWALYASYNNQFRNFSVLENKEFVPAKVSSLGIGLSFDIWHGRKLIRLKKLPVI